LNPSRNGSKKILKTRTHDKARALRAQKSVIREINVRKKRWHKRPKRKVIRGFSTHTQIKRRHCRPEEENYLRVRHLHSNIKERRCGPEELSVEQDDKFHKPRKSIISKKSFPVVKEKTLPVLTSEVTLQFIELSL
jgi:hypothetical protein